MGKPCLAHTLYKTGGKLNLINGPKFANVARTSSYVLLLSTTTQKTTQPKIVP